MPRERVFEHANADLDNGWSGQSHDSGVVEGGGYVADLYDCDGPAGPDTLCTVGPSCTVTRCQGGLNAGATCTADSECPGGRCAGAACSNDTQCGVNAPCRKKRTAVGPHCNLDIQQACTNNGNCPGTGNFCLKTYHGAPLPLSAGGVSVCVLNIFSEDVVGTTDLATGTGAIRLRQDSVTHLGPSIEEPCPACGGFCGDPPNGIRDLCATNADCGAGPLRSTAVRCVTDPICSFGPNVDKDCRPDPPFGGGTEFFGTASVDCPPFAGANISGSGLDILFNPVTTNSVTFKPNVACDQVGFGGKTCVDGSNQGATCTTDSQCPGGTCNFQCFCPTGGGRTEKPNDCDAACVGGTNDREFCNVDSECPGGFCHQADCRDTTGICQGGTNALASCTDDSECPGGTCGDPSGANEGACASGPTQGTCSVHPFKTCLIDTDCQGLSCTFCDPFPLETCVIKPRQCFVNSGIIRTGVAALPPADRTGVAAFCEGGTSAPSINNTAGLPGPAAIRQPELTHEATPGRRMVVPV
jgi:hypothetical protein